MQIATIGYEHDTLPGVIGRLKAAGVEVVIDVRAVASSRRAGFSKTILAATLREQGIDYVHLRQLGTPKPGRQAAHAGRVDEMLEIYAAHMEEPGAQLELIKAGEIAKERKAALLCYEHDAACCHRHVLAERLHDALGLEVKDL